MNVAHQNIENRDSPWKIYCWGFYVALIGMFAFMFMKQSFVSLLPTSISESIWFSYIDLVIIGGVYFFTPFLVAILVAQQIGKYFSWLHGLPTTVILAVSTNLVGLTLLQIARTFDLDIGSTTIVVTLFFTLSLIGSFFGYYFGIQLAEKGDSFIEHSRPFGVKKRYYLYIMWGVFLWIGIFPAWTVQIWLSSMFETSMIYVIPFAVIYGAFVSFGWGINKIQKESNSWLDVLQSFLGTVGYSIVVLAVLVALSLIFDL